MNATLKEPPKRRAKRNDGLIRVVHESASGYVATLNGVRTQSQESYSKAAMKCLVRATGTTGVIREIQRDEDEKGRPRWTFEIREKQEQFV